MQRAYHYHRCLLRDWDELRKSQKSVLTSEFYEQFHKLLQDYEALIEIDTTWQSQQATLTALIRNNMAEGRHFHKRLKRAVKTHVAPERQAWFDFRYYTHAQRSQERFLHYLKHLQKMLTQEWGSLQRSTLNAADRQALHRLIDEYEQALTDRNTLEAAYQEATQRRKALRERLEAFIRLIARYGKLYYKQRDRLRYEDYRLSSTK